LIYLTKYIKKILFCEDVDTNYLFGGGIVSKANSSLLIYFGQMYNCA